MKKPTHAEMIDPLLGRSYDKGQLQPEDSEQTRDPWTDPENLKIVGVDEFTAHRLAKELKNGPASGLSPNFSGTTTRLEEIFPRKEVDELKAREYMAISDAGRGVLPSGYRGSLEKIEPKSQEQLRQELGLNQVTNGQEAPTDGGVQQVA